MQFDAVRCNAPLTVQEVKEDDAANRGCPREGAVLVTHWTFRREKASLREFHRPAMLRRAAAGRTHRLVPVSTETGYFHSRLATLTSSAPHGLVYRRLSSQADRHCICAGAARPTSTVTPCRKRVAVAFWRKRDNARPTGSRHITANILLGSGRKVATIAGVLVLAGGAAFAASWFVGQVTGGAGQNVVVAAGWERATLK